MNLSTRRPKGRGLLEVHPEPCSPTPPSKAGLRTAERVNTLNNRIGIVISLNLYYKIVTFRLVTGKSAGCLAPCLPAVGKGRGVSLIMSHDHFLFTLTPLSAVAILRRE
jgi:hypothetical protein